MKIIRIATSLHFGGVERRLVNLSEWEDKHEWVFVGIEGGGEAAEHIQNNRKRVELLNVSGRIPSWRAFWSLIRLFKKERPDVVHTSGAEANFHGIFAAKVAGVKCIIGEEIGIPCQSGLAKKVFGFTYGLTNAVIANSAEVLNFLRIQNNVNTKQLHLISNPVLIPKRKHIPLSNGEFFEIVTVSRLESVKNIEGILNVLSTLPDRLKRFRFRMVGEGSQKGILIKLVKELGLENQVVFTGFQKEPWEFIEEADLFVLNSNTEGFSNSLAEAMAQGIPVLCTSVGAATEMIEDGANGYLVQSNDSEALQSKLIEIMGLPKPILNKIGEKGKEIVLSKYSLEKHMEKLMKVYFPDVRFDKK